MKFPKILQYFGHFTFGHVPWNIWAQEYFGHFPFSIFTEIYIMVIFLYIMVNYLLFIFLSRSFSGLPLIHVFWNLEISILSWFNFSDQSWGWIYFWQLLNQHYRFKIQDLIHQQIFFIHAIFFDPHYSKGDLLTPDSSSRYGYFMGLLPADNKCSWIYAANFLF